MIIPFWQGLPRLIHLSWHFPFLVLFSYLFLQSHTRTMSLSSSQELPTATAVPAVMWSTIPETPDTPNAVFFSEAAPPEPSALYRIAGMPAALCLAIFISVVKPDSAVLCIVMFGIFELALYRAFAALFCPLWFARRHRRLTLLCVVRAFCDAWWWWRLQAPYAVSSMFLFLELDVLVEKVLSPVDAALIQSHFLVGNEGFHLPTIATCRFASSITYVAVMFVGSCVWDETFHPARYEALALEEDGSEQDGEVDSIEWRGGDTQTQCALQTPAGATSPVSPQTNQGRCSSTPLLVGARPIDTATTGGTKTTPVETLSTPRTDKAQARTVLGPNVPAQPPSLQTESIGPPPAKQQRRKRSRAPDEVSAKEAEMSLPAKKKQKQKQTQKPRRSKRRLSE